MMASHQHDPNSSKRLQELDDLYSQLTSPWSTPLNFMLAKGGAVGNLKTYDLSAIIGKKVTELGWPSSTQPVEVQRPHRLYFNPNVYPTHIGPTWFTP